MNDKKQLSTSIDIGRLGEYWNEEVVYEDGFEVGIQQHED